ncbi:hypothetical protein ASG43_08730 [Aureimonas sp. Leaf454]|nr:hypothetical protein ASG43_08730 [Aureimonas sp. Leaf454]
MDVLKPFRVRLVRSVALLTVAGLTAGCSADVARFDDGFYTGSVPQSIPQSRVARGAPANLDQMATGSVRPSGIGNNPGAGMRETAMPSYGQGGDGQDGGYGQAAPVRTASVERTMLPPPAAASSQPEPVYARPAEPAMAPVTAAQPMPASQPAPVSQSMPAASSAPGKPAKAGWSDTGNRVALRGGETIDTLADRYGVPAKAILAVNGMKSAADAQPGQSIAIPTYSYGQSSKQAARGPAGQTLGAPPSPLRVPSASEPAPAPVMAAAPVKPAVKGSTIVVESGDSVLGIARRNGVSAKALREANGLTDDQIRIGQKLVMPNGAAPAKRVAALETKPAPVKPATAVAATAPAKPQPAAAPVAAAEPVVKTPKAYEPPRAAEPAKAEPKASKPVVAAVEAPAPAATAPTSTVEDEADTEVATATPSGTGIDQFRWPVQGRVVKRFGEKSGARRNDGLDISVPRGTPIKAAENGVVIYAGDGLKEFGNTVLVKHSNGLVTVYGHADDLKVKRGATVKRGQEIATAGMTGDTETPQVHFEVRKDSAPVDPMKFLK